MGSPKRSAARNNGHPCAVALAVFCATQLAVWYFIDEVVTAHGKLGSAQSSLMLHPTTGWVALTVVSLILLLGRQLSAGGIFAGLTSRWRNLHVSRLPANSDVCVQIQRLRHPVLDVFCRAFGFCAEEDFYMILAPVCWWVLPFLQPFFFNLMLVALFGLLVGDALKDMLYIPRPSHPLLWTHSHSKGTAQEYGMPSTHAMNAVSNSLIFALCAGGECGNYATIGLQQSSVSLLAKIWVFGICTSRLYLGVHTVDDIAVGCALGALVVRLWLLVHSHVNHWVDDSSPCVPALTIAIITGMLFCARPRPPTPTPSRRQSANISGLLSGLLLATWATGRETRIPERFPPSFSAWEAESLKIVAGRLIVGLGVAFGGEQLIKRLATPFFSKALDEPEGYKSERVYMPVKFLSQTWMAIGICCAPLAMRQAGVW